MPNLTLPNILSRTEKIQLGDDYQQIVLNEQLRTSITLCKVTTGVYDPSTGIMAENWTRKVSYAIRGNYDLKDVAMGAGMFQLRESGESLATYALGDVFFLVPEENYITDLGGDIILNDVILEIRYKTGGITVTNSSTTVTGSGTVWTKNAGKGNWIRVNYESTFYELSKTPTSDTSLTLVSAYGGVSKSGQVYEIYTEYIVMLVQKDPTGLLRRIHCRRIS